jgi:signal transduction histidine kinase
MSKDAVFGLAKSNGFNVSVSTLTLGTLYEAVLAFSSQDRFETFWPSVCQNARWLIPSRRMVILLDTEEQNFEIQGMFGQGEFQTPADSQFVPTDQLKRILAKKNAQWFENPRKQFRGERDTFITWLLQDQPDMLFALPILVKGKSIGALLFAMGSVSEADQAMLNTLGTIYALHTGMTYTLICLTEERMQMQKQLLTQEKMASLGNLVAGVAHEVNNPIAAIISAADVSVRCIGTINDFVINGESLDQIKEHTKFQKSIRLLLQNNELIGNAGQRIAKLVQSLKNFARLEEAEFQSVSIHEGIESALTLMQHEIKEGVQVVKDYGELPRLFCCPGELNQVFMTLLRNASQAIERKGVITITTGADKENLCVIISDTGKGMNPEELKSLLDFRFTTKQSRVTMATGLVNAYNIIQKHRGHITVESEVGKGTTFTVILPKDRGKAQKRS